MTWHRRMAERSPRGPDQFHYRMGHLKILKITLFVVLLSSAFITFYFIVLSQSWRSERRMIDNYNSVQLLMEIKAVKQAEQSVKDKAELLNKVIESSRNKSRLEQKVIHGNSTSKLGLKHDAQAPPKNTPVGKHQSPTEAVLRKNASSRIAKKPHSTKQSKSVSIQQQRQHTLWQACEEVFHIPPMDLNSKAPLSTGFRGTVSSSTMVNDDFNLTVTAVGDVSSSYWRIFMLHLRRLSSQKFRDRWPSAWGLDKRDDTEAKHCLRHYTKVLFVSNPLTRLLQAFRHNFAKPRSIFYAQKAKVIIKRVQATRQTNGSAPSLSFLEFLQYVVADTKHTIDLRLRPIFRTTKPCMVQYDFIGKMETLGQDTEYLITKLGVKDRKGLKPTGPHPGIEDTAVAARYYSQIPEDVVEKVREIYQEDFIAFDYPLPDSSNLTAYFRAS